MYDVYGAIDSHGVDDVELVRRDEFVPAVMRFATA
jgi:hypothetical protein